MKILMRFAVPLALIMLAIPPVRAADEPYEIYAITSQTGVAAFLGRGEASTLAVFERYVNATGGINGRPVRIVIADDQSTPTVAVQLVNGIIAKHAPVFIGPGFGATCAASLSLIENGPVMYCMANSIHPVTGSYAFSYSPSTKELIAAGIRYVKAKGVTKLGLLVTTDTSGQDGETLVPEILKAPEFKDMKLVANEFMAVSDLSVTAQMGRIKAAGAQALVVWMAGTPFGTVLRATQDAGYDGPIVTGGSQMNKGQMVQYAPFVPKDVLMIAQPYAAIGTSVPERVTREKTIFLNWMNKGGIPVPDALQWIAWDPGLIVVDALRHIGTQATAKDVRDYIAKLHDFAGVNGMYDFRRGDQRGIAPQSSVVVRWNKANQVFDVVSRPGGLPM